jgi:hypothetical protein
MEGGTRRLFERYERLLNQALGGETDMDAAASLYASEFIGSAPAGIRAGKNDASFREAMAEGYARYRTIGTKAMRIRDIRLAPIDEHHGVAHVAWTATYVRKDGPDIAIDFDVHYLVRDLDGGPKVFGWVSGDEEALLRRHGIL